MSADSSKVCPTNKATLAASLRQLCAGTNAYSKAQEALKACEESEENLGSTPIYGTCGLKFLTTFCGNPVTPFIEISTNFINPSPINGASATAGASGVVIQVTSSIIQNVIFTATLTDANGNPVIVKCLGIPTVTPGSVFFNQANQTVSITVNIPFDSCTGTESYYFKLCAVTDNNCITCIMGTIKFTSDVFMIGVGVSSGSIPVGFQFGVYNSKSEPFACLLGGVLCPSVCFIPCGIFPDITINDIFIYTNINATSLIQVTASGSCPSGAGCYYGNNPPANCGLLSQVSFSPYSVPYSIDLFTFNFAYGFAFENLQIPGFEDTNHDLAFTHIYMIIKAEDCVKDHMATLGTTCLLTWFHCYQSS